MKIGNEQPPTVTPAGDAPDPPQLGREELEAVREPIRLEYGNALDAAVGARHGLSVSELEQWWERVDGLLADFRSVRSPKRPAFLDLPERDDLLAEVRALEPLLEGRDTLVVLGMGGTVLGTRAIHEAIWGPHHALMAGRPGGPARRLFFADNIDPESFCELLSLLDPARTLFNVVSKSGSTIETMAQCTVAWRWVVSALGEAAAPRSFVFTTGFESALRHRGEQLGVPVLTLPDEIGLRFSVLTPVGLFPAMASGIEPEQLLEGALDMQRRALRPKLDENPAANLALLHVLLDRLRGKSIAVMMPYTDRLRGFAEWFCQLWAESLGKSTTPSGEERAPVGQTPLRAIGSSDQHTQLQLFVEGPNDKLMTLLSVGAFRRDATLGAEGLRGGASDLDYLRGHSLGRVLEVEELAMEMVLRGSERPTIVWRLPCVNAHVLGQLFQVYQITCALAAGLHHVDPFSQPGLEDGKLLVFGALGRPGYESIGAELTRYQKRPDVRVVS